MGRDVSAPKRNGASCAGTWIWSRGYIGIGQGTTKRGGVLCQESGTAQPASAESGSTKTPNGARGVTNMMGGGECCGPPGIGDEAVMKVLVAMGKAR